MKKLFILLSIFLMIGVIGVFAQESLPFSEDFADATFPPTGWSLYQLIPGTTSNWERHADGGGSAFHNDINATHDSWLVSPQISIPASGSIEISFNQKNYYMTYYGRHSLMVSDGSGDPTGPDWVEIQHYPTDMATFTLTTEDLSAYHGSDIYIAFVYTGTYASRWWVDDVLVREIVDYDVMLTQVTPDMLVDVTGADQTLFYQLTVTNMGAQNDNYTFSLSKAWATGIYADELEAPLPFPFTVNGGDSADVYVKVVVPSTVVAGDFSIDNVQVNGNGVSDDVDITTTVIDVLYYNPFSTQILFDEMTEYQMGDYVPPERAWQWQSTNLTALHYWTTGGEYADNWFVSPMISIPSAKYPGRIFLDFWELGYDGGYYGYNGLWISNGSPDPADGDYVEISEILPADAFTNRVFDLGDYMGQDVYLAWVYRGNDCNSWQVTEILVYDNGAEAPDTYTVTLLADPDDIGVVLTGAGDYEDGVRVDIEASLPPKAMVFVEWTGSAQDVALLDNASSAATFFTMPTRNVTLTAVFLEEYDVSLVNATGDSLVQIGESFFYNLVVTNTGALSNDYTFSLSKAWADGLYADTSETPLAVPLNIAPGGSVDVYLKVTVPGGTPVWTTTDDIVDVAGTGCSDSVTVTTTAANIFLSENFATGFDGWSIYQMADLTTVNWEWNSAGYMQHSWTDAGEYADNWLVSPQISINQARLGTIELYFWEAFVDSAYNDYHGVWVSTGSGDPNDGGFAEFFEIPPVGADGSFYERSYDFSAFAGQDVYIAFVYRGEYADLWAITNVMVYDDAYEWPAETYTVTLLADPDDIGVVLTGAGDYEAGAPVNISASLIGKAWVFVEWVGDPGDVALLNNAYSSSTFFTMPDRNLTLTAQFYDAGDYIPAAISLENELVDGIWQWTYSTSKGSVWQLLADGVIAVKMMTADITGDSVIDLVVQFTDTGFWYYNFATSSWGQFLAPEDIVNDFTLAQTSVGGLHEMVAAVDSEGVLRFEVGIGWGTLFEHEVYVIAAADLTRNGVDELILGINGTVGLFVYNFADESIIRIAEANPSQIIKADVTGDGYDEVIAVFNGLGVYMIRYIPDKNITLKQYAKNPFDLVKDIPVNSEWISKHKSGKGLQFNRITWGTPDTGTRISAGDIAMGDGAEVFIVHQNRTYYYCGDTLAWATLLHSPLKRILAGQFTGMAKDDLLVCESNSGDIWLWHNNTSSWERILAGGNTNAMAVLE